MFSDYIYKWLDNALDAGITEQDFWCMTLGELRRALASKKRALENQEKRKATFDYILADLIGHSVSRAFNSSNTMPKLSDAYPSLFNSVEEAEKIQEKKDELSALRFTLFAQSFNKRFEGVTDKK